MQGNKAEQREAGSTLKVNVSRYEENTNTYQCQNVTFGAANGQYLKQIRAVDLISQIKPL